MNRLVVGLGIGATRIRAVGTVGGAVRWAVQAERHADESLDTALGALLSECPLNRSRFGRRALGLCAVGPSESQLKLLERLPALSEAVDLAAAVQESAQRFFLHWGAQLVTTAVLPVDRTSGWGAAFDGSVVASLEAACREAQVSLVGIVPAAAALPYATEDDEFTWDDAEIRLWLSAADRQLTGVRRTVTDRERQGGMPLTPVSPLAVLGNEAGTFADAYGATLIPRNSPLVLSGRANALASVPSKGRLGLAGSMLAVTALAAFTGPALTASYEARVISSRLDDLGPADRQVQRASAELTKVTNELRELGEFDAKRRSPTALLRDLSGALPVHSALTMLSVDSAGGTIVTLAAHAADVVDALEKIPGVASPTLIGPVTRESAGGLPMERATIAFQLLDRNAPPSNQPPTTREWP